MFVPCGTAARRDFKGFTLLMPSVSVGNVGQLVIDLVISTLDMPKVGYFYTDCLVPMVGNNPYATAEENSTELSINAEVYSLPSKKLVVLQIRSPFIKNKYRSFCQTVLSWVKSSKCARVILLSSSHAYQRDDQQLHGTPLRYLLSPTIQKTVGDQMQKLNWKEMEKVAAYPEINNAEKVLHIPGGGITKLLFTERILLSMSFSFVLKKKNWVEHQPAYSHFKKTTNCSKEIPMAVLLKFCSEGDNIPDALALVNYLNEWLQLIKNESSSTTTTASHWKIPSSWRLLFGSGLPPALF
ncbi:proteasome assembly chaperone 2 isoform X2 [Alligator sinensis]|uniref:Proteasome assembly chaperone 2 n=1 Tax=Alligator sinensis TaxID=38654 RepID=A0A3Q0GQP8_ALLSI|nr:proteasome assembly chaperone 2 isoform X2 [Alligator sinensis]